MAMIQLFVAVLLATASADVAWATGLDAGSAGIVAAQRGDYDEAIRLFTSAIASGELSPRNSMLAYHNRGNTYQDKENYAQAIADYSTVIRLQPDYAQAWYSRGRAQFALGIYAAAIADFTRSIALDPTDGYSVLWLQLARSNTAKPDITELMRNSRKVALARWPGPLVNLYLGKATADQARAASVMGDVETGTDRACEAAFFIGEYQLMRKNVATAKSLFQDAVKACPYTSDERDGAVVELKRLR